MNRTLTDAELRIVRLVAVAKSDKEVGLDLGISHLTVKKHLDRIRAKTGRRTRTDLTLWAVARGIVANPYEVAE